MFYQKLILSEKYLLTLGTNKEYIFRVITKDNYSDVTVKISFEGSKLIASSNDYKNNDEISFILEGAQKVKFVYLNGILIEDYTLDGNKITLSNDIVKYLTIDTHKLTVYTENGRPEVSFVVSETFDVEVEEITETDEVLY